MRLDSHCAPSLLNLRMNYRNIVNEMTLHNGQMVSHQFFVMRPRRKNAWSRPRSLEPPEGCDKALFLKVARKRAREKELLLFGPSTVASGAREDGPEGNFDEDIDGQAAEGFQDTDDEEEKAAKPSKVRDPTQLAEVQELLSDERVRAVHKSLSDPYGGFTRRTQSIELLEAPADAEDAPEGIEEVTGCIPQGRLPRALEVLGFPEPDPDLIKESLRTLLKYDPSKPMLLELDEFCVIVHNFQKNRSELLRQQFARLDGDGSGTISTKEFRYMLWDMGFTVSLETVEEIFGEVDDDRSGQVELAEFEAALTIVHERYGFTKAEAADLYEVFDRYDSDNSGEMGADELAAALGWLGTPCTVAEAKTVMDKFDEEGDGTLRKPEFLMVMRARLEEEIRNIRRLFAEFDSDSSGTMSTAEIVELFQSIGYTVPKDVIVEGIKELGQQNNTMGLIFEDVLKLLDNIKRREGFSMKEKKELEEVFDKFDGSGRQEMREFELARAMNWLGYPLSQTRRRELWCRVDVDKSNKIDKGEFLKLVRILREDETKASRVVLSQLSSSAKFFQDSELKNFLFKLGYAPPPPLFDQAVKMSLDTNDSGGADVLGVLAILRFVREGQVQKFRLCAGLSDKQADKVRSKFGAKTEAGKKVEEKDLEKFMLDMFKTAKHNPVERERIKTTIKENIAGDKKLDLMAIFWAVRSYGDMREEDLYEREEKVVMDAKFDENSVGQFRKAFAQADDDGSGALNEKEIKSVSKNIMSLSTAQEEILKKEIENMGELKECIDFPEFLRIMGVLKKAGEEEAAKAKEEAAKDGGAKGPKKPALTKLGSIMNRNAAKIAQAVQEERAKEA